MNIPGYIELLQRLIATPSVSRQEDATAGILMDYMSAKGLKPRRYRNNVYALSSEFVPGRPTLLLNSHHDTVRPAEGYTRDPYAPIIEGDRLYGLGSNDAGASAVALTEAFAELPGSLPFNVVLAITAEEEVGGENGMRAFLPLLSQEGVSVDCAIVGEPTGLQAAVGERGLVVFDCLTRGKAGHAARNEGLNAIYLALEDIERLRRVEFPLSDVLGASTLNVTQINAGKSHNTIPDECRWVIDLRTTDAMPNEEAADYLRGKVRHSELVPRSTRVRPSVITGSHPLVSAAVASGSRTFVSPTTSDMSLLWDIPSVKIGPGESSRSHSADEYVLLSEIADGIKKYKAIIRNLNL